VLDDGRVLDDGGALDDRRPLDADRGGDLGAGRLLDDAAADQRRWRVSRRDRGGGHGGLLLGLARPATDDRARRVDLGGLHRRRGRRRLLPLQGLLDARHVVGVERRHVVVHLEAERTDLRQELLVGDPDLFGNLVNAHLGSVGSVTSATVGIGLK
jgi:hypothetical protein